MSGRASPAGKQLLAQWRIELLLTLRRGESVLITIVVPTVLLLFFTALNLAPSGNAIDFLLPGMVALAVMATGMVSLGIATAYERYYGVLKRLGALPLPRWILLAAKALAVLCVEVIQVAMLIAIGLAYGWRPSAEILLAVVPIILGTAAFAGFGLYMAGSWRAEATLAGANGLYLACLLLGDGVLPLDHLPLPLHWLAAVLPAAALTDSLRALFTNGAPFPSGSLLLLTAWAVAMAALAAATFRWE